MSGRRRNNIKKAGRPCLNVYNMLKNHNEKERDNGLIQKENELAALYGIPLSARREEKLTQIAERMEDKDKEFKEMEAAHAKSMRQAHEGTKWLLMNYDKLSPEDRQSLLNQPMFAICLKQMGIRFGGFPQQPQPSLPQVVPQQMPCSLGLQQISQSPALENDQQAVMFEWSVEEQQQEPSLGEQQPMDSEDNQPFEIQKQTNVDPDELDKLLQPWQPQEASLPESQPTENQTSAPQNKRNFDFEELYKLLEPRHPQEASLAESSQPSENKAAAPQNDQQAVMFEWSVKEQQQDPSLEEQQPIDSEDNQPFDIQKQQNFDPDELDKLLQPWQPQEASFPESSQSSENQAAAPQNRLASNSRKRPLSSINYGQPQEFSEKQKKMKNHSTSSYCNEDVSQGIMAGSSTPTSPSSSLSNSSTESPEWIR